LSLQIVCYLPEVSVLNIQLSSCNNC